MLDALFEQDGQTLVALTAPHDMTRIAVAKHLRLLEEAGLVVSRRRGREKVHYLNTVPIRLLHDRWVSKYTEPWAAGLTGLKAELEQSMEKVFEIYIRTTPERLWQAITDPKIRCEIPLRRRHRIGVDDGLPLRAQTSGGGWVARRGRESRRRTAAKTRADNARPVERGSRNVKARHGSAGRSNPSATPAGSP